MFARGLRHRFPLDDGETNCHPTDTPVPAAKVSRRLPKEIGEFCLSWFRREVDELAVPRAAWRGRVRQWLFAAHGFSGRAGTTKPVRQACLPHSGIIFSAQTTKPDDVPG